MIVFRFFTVLTAMSYVTLSRLSSARCGAEIDYVKKSSA